MPHAPQNFTEEQVVVIFSLTLLTFSFSLDWFIHSVYSVCIICFLIHLTFISSLSVRLSEDGPSLSTQSSSCMAPYSYSPPCGPGLSVSGLTIINSPKRSLHQFSECCKKIVGPSHVDPQLGSSELCTESRYKSNYPVTRSLGAPPGPDF